MTDRGQDPILIVPYQWIGDFVRGHSVVRLLKSQDPSRLVDILASSNNAPLADYMPGVRQAIVADLPRRRLAFSTHFELSQRLAAGKYGQVLVFPKTFKAALAPWMAKISKRTGLLGELRFGVLNDLRYDIRRLPRMIDQCAALALPPHAPLPAEWPLPELVVPAGEIAAWRARNDLAGRAPAVALAPGAVGPAKRWHDYAALAKKLAAAGIAVWIVGGPGERAQAQEIVAAEPKARDLTGTDLRNAILALAAADAAVSNDSGLLHVAAALNKPAVGIFGPTDPWFWAPLNPLAALAQADVALDCRPCHKPVCRPGHHMCMTKIPAERIFGLVTAALREPAARAGKIAAPMAVARG